MTAVNPGEQERCETLAGVAGTVPMVAVARVMDACISDGDSWLASAMAAVRRVTGGMTVVSAACTLAMEAVTLVMEMRFMDGRFSVPARVGRGRGG